MEKITLTQLIEAKDPSFKKYPGILSSFTQFLLHRFFKEKKVNQYLHELEDKSGRDFVNKLFELLKFSYNLSEDEKKRIPAEGRLIVIANHPLGVLDGLLLYKIIAGVRNDVKVMTNDLLLNLENLSEIFIRMEGNSFSERKEGLIELEEALDNDGAVIIFPSVQVSRPTLKGIRDKNWQPGAIKLAMKKNSAILPCYISGMNSAVFYTSNVVNKDFSKFLLPREVLKKSSKDLKVNIGKVIPSSAFQNIPVDISSITKLLKKHTYLLKKGKKEIFQTEETIIHPVDKDLVLSDLNKMELLGETKDSKKIYLADISNAKNLQMEIGRLREITFRKVGEGTGKTYDLDDYDHFYKHIVLWDEKDHEIVGSYRLGICKEIIANKGIKGIYNSELFDFNDNFNPVLDETVELGRSFVQMKYWGSNALDYLWQGIGAFLSNYPEYRYLFGAVSISDNYPEAAKALLILYHEKWFMNKENYAKSQNPFRVSESLRRELSPMFDADEPKKDFMTLKKALREFGLSVPVLLRRYVELTELGGSTFIDFGVDESFGNSVDCLILVDLKLIKEDFKKRYYKSYE